MATSDMWTGVGSALASLVVIWSLMINHVQITMWINKIISYFSAYCQITISEYGAERFQRSDFFVAVEAYLSDTCACRVRKLRAELGSDRKTFQVSVDDKQQFTDTFGDHTFWWHTYTEHPRNMVIVYRPGDDQRRFYQVVFHRSLRNIVINSYLPSVIEKGRAIAVRDRQRRLFTNNPSKRWDTYSYYSYGKKTFWSHVAFEHPATFATLAMDPTKKDGIIDDLNAFKEGKEYYARVGRAWKRGYLLHGPPGTGKSTMIAAMANMLEYDIYDLELTAVKNNTELRKLFIETTEKSIIVVEDIDCSVDLTGKRKDKKARKKSRRKSQDMTKLTSEDEDDGDDTKLTLSGMLNFIDGLWSACGGERIIIFTTNNKENLDKALIRAGRMDMHIEMSYCRYEAFKVLANNYLDINEQQLFDLFSKIGELLEQVDMTPADVAEKLMRTKKRDADVCLEGLMDALRKAKEKKEKQNEEAEKCMDKQAEAAEMRKDTVGENEWKDNKGKGLAC